MRPRTPDTPRVSRPERRVLARVGPDRLRVAGRLAVDRGARGLGGHVVHGQPGAARGEDEAHAAVVGQPLQRGHDRVAVVGHQLVLDLEPRRLAEIGYAGRPCYGQVFETPGRPRNARGRGGNFGAGVAIANISVVQPPAHGSFRMIGLREFQYTPSASLRGWDRIVLR